MDLSKIEATLNQVEELLCTDFGITEIVYQSVGKRTVICLATQGVSGNELLGHTTAMKEILNADSPAIRLIALNIVHKQLLAAYSSKKAMEVNTIFSLVSSKNGRIILEFKDNADIYYDGRLIDNDKDVVNGFRDYLCEKGILTK